MAQLQKRKPSRMTLSPRVAQSSPRISPSGKPVKRRTNNPWGGMNVTDPPRSSAVRQRSQASEKRETRFVPNSRKKRDEKEKSTEPFKALKMQRALSPISYGQRTAIKKTLEERDTFDAFGLLPDVEVAVATQALGNMDDITPTPIQRLAIPALLGNEHQRRRSRSSVSHVKEMEQFLLAAETGSGKTLAYLLPVIDAIKRAEVQEKAQKEREAADREANRKANDLELLSPLLSNAPHPSTGRPRAIILLPTSELVSQVGALVKSLSHTVKFRSALISAAYTGKVIRTRLFSPNGIDVLISTPHLLSSITESDPNVLSRVTHLVIDEADSLLDRSFSPLTPRESKPEAVDPVFGNDTKKPGFISEKTLPRYSPSHDAESARHSSARTARSRGHRQRTLPREPQSGLRRHHLEHRPRSG
ncbi:RNA helicase [Elasticomyces elasticus]|nr:RNA helicase [Elasticomyces elasticus]